MRAVFILLTILLLPLPSAAEMLRFEFSAVVSGTPSGIFAGAVAGEPLSGFYRYDSRLTGAPGANPSESISWFGFLNPGMIWEFEIDVGGVTRSTAGAAAGGGNPWPILALTDDPSTDAFSLIIGQVGSENDDQAILSLSDMTPVPPDGVAVGSGNLGTAVPSLPPDPGLFDESNCSYIARDVGGVETGAVSFQLTSVGAPAAVPSLGIHAIATLVAVLGGVATLAIRRRALSDKSEKEPAQ